MLNRGIQKLHFIFCMVLLELEKQGEILIY
jgi:hypothetical protein